MSAYFAAKNNARVIVVNKGRIQRTGATIMAPGAISAVDDRWKQEGDSKTIHFEDTVRGGSFLNDQEMVKSLCEKSPELVLELERMGALFQREADGVSYKLRIDGGHRFPRCPFLEDRTGKEMLKAMVGALRKLHVPFLENVMVTRLVREKGCVVGAVGVGTQTGDPVVLESKAVVLATGGGGTIYENTDNPIDLTGDGYALALDAGISLRDMEFVQFYPVGFLFPPALKGMLAGLPYYCRLYNAPGERFMENYDPERLELSTRDRVSQAIMREVRAGRGTPRGGVYMDMTYQEPGFIARMTPALYATYRNIGIDPEKERVEVAPTVHFFMGGMEVDSKWSTELPGLFGSGEVCGGMHGGNRLSQNALAEILVSGMVSGEEAAKYASRAPSSSIDPGEALLEARKIEEILGARGGEAPSTLKRRIRQVMWEHVGVFRTEGSLDRALEEISCISSLPVRITQKDRYLNRELLEAMEIRNMVKTAEAVIRSALCRKESRASHYREDFPATDTPNFLKNFLVRQGRNGLEVHEKKVNTKYLQPEEL